MKKTYSMLIVLAMALVMALSMSVPAFAYTATDDDGDRSTVTEGTMGVVYSNMGMLRTMDDGTTVKDNGDGTVTVNVVTSTSKSWSKITKLALIEETATDAEKDAAAAGVEFKDNTFFADKSVSRAFTFTIPKTDLGKRIPVCRYVSTSETEGAWQPFSTPAYYIVETAAVPVPLPLDKLDTVMMTINSAEVYKAGAAYKVNLVIKNTSYTKAFKGYASEANQDDTGAVDIVNDTENKVSYVTLTFDKLNEETVFAFKGSKYFNRSFTLTEDKLMYSATNISLDQFDNMTLEEALARAQDDSSVETVNALIEAIYVQSRDENTDKYCALAKAYYDALSASDKGKLDEPDYFGLDTGDASLDDPLNTLPDKKRELLVVSFGTSFNDSRVATIGAVEKALQKAYPLYAVRRAFTAQIIINHIQSRDGEKIDNVKQAMDKAVEAGVKTMIVQPTHLMSGYEYDELKAEIDKYADKIHISYAKPLLDSDEDKTIVAKALADKAAAQAGFDSVADAAAEGTAFVFMGHGTSHEASATYDIMQAKYAELGYANCFVGTVEGVPEDTALPAVKEAVEDAGYTKVILRPMMVVAGDHANNDMAADEEGSWYYGFAYGGDFEVEGSDEAVDIGDGFEPENVDCQINGLGEIKAVQDLYIAHTRAVAAEEDPITKTEEFIKFIKDYVLQYIQSEDARAAYDWITGQYDSYKAIADLILEYPEAINVYGEWLDEYIKEVNKYAQAFQESPEVQAAVDEVIAKAEELKKLLDEYEISSADDLIAKIKEAKEELEKAVEDFIASVNEEMISEAIDALIEKAVENGFDPAIIDQIEDIIDQAKEIAGMSQDELLEKALEAAFEAFEMLEDGEFDEYLEAAGLEPQFVKDLVDDVLSYAIGYMFGDTYNAVTDRLYDALDELEETKAEVEKLKQALADAKKAGDDRAEIIKKFKNGYKVQNKKPTIKKVKNLKKKKIKVTFKGLKGVTATKYQIQAKAKKAKAKKAWVKKSTTSAKKLNKTLKKLKKGKKYTVKVRALYQFKYQGKTYKFWSKWSKAKKVKVKK